MNNVPAHGGIASRRGSRFEAIDSDLDVRRRLRASATPTATTRVGECARQQALLHTQQNQLRAADDSGRRAFVLAREIERREHALHHHVRYDENRGPGA